MGSYPAPSIAYNSYLRNSCLTQKEKAGGLQVTKKVLAVDQTAFSKPAKSSSF